jgi:hypothetical protein
MELGNLQQLNCLTNGKCLHQGDFFNPKPGNSLPLEIEPETKKCYLESLAIELNALSQPTITI